jgi:hypothetical protein
MLFQHLSEVLITIYVLAIHTIKLGAPIIEDNRLIQVYQRKREYLVHEHCHVCLGTTCMLFPTPSPSWIWSVVIIFHSYSNIS